MPSKYEKRLKSMQDSWDAGREAAGQGAVPDNIYTMQLQTAELTESGSGKLQVHRQHLVLEGEHSGSVQDDWMQMETPQGPRFIIRWIERMGVEAPEDMADIEESLAELTENAPIYTARVKTNDQGFTNVNVNQLVEREGGKPKTDKGGGADELEVDDEVSFEDNDGDTLDGKITEIDGTEATVDVDGEEYAVDLEDLNSAENKSSNGADELVEFAQAQGIDIDDDDDADSITDKILEKEWDKSELTEDEVELLEGLGASFKKKKKTKKTKNTGKKKKIAKKKKR